jgi:hypothetical protein
MYGGSAAAGGDRGAVGARLAELAPLAPTEVAEVAEASDAIHGIPLSPDRAEECLRLLCGSTPTLRWLAGRSRAELRAYLTAPDGLASQPDDPSPGSQPSQLRRIVATYLSVQWLFDRGWPHR